MGRTLVELCSNFGHATHPAWWPKLSHSQALPQGDVGRWSLMVDGPYAAMVHKRAWTVERHELQVIEATLNAKGLRLAQHLTIRPADSEPGTRRPRWQLCNCHVPAGGKKVKVQADYGRGAFLHTASYDYFSNSL